jgi:hypothetical protein
VRLIDNDGIVLDPSGERSCPQRDPQGDHQRALVLAHGDKER